MKFEKVFTFKRTFTEQEFAERARDFLVKQPNMPLDIVEAKIQNVRLVYTEALYCRAHIEADYTVRIAFSALEKHASGEDTAYGINEEPSLYGVNALSFDKDVTPEQLIEEDFAVEVNEGALERAKDLCAHGVIMSKKPYDGTLVDEGDYEARVLELTCYRLPYYVADVEYGGRIYTISTVACKDALCTDIPLVETAALPSGDNVTERVVKKTQQLKKFESLAQKVFYGVAAACFVLGAALHAKWLILFTLVNFAVTLVLPRLHKKKIEEEVKGCIEEKIGRTNGIASWTEEEKEEIKRVYTQIGEEIYTKNSATVFPLNCLLMGLSLIVLVL